MNVLEGPGLHELLRDHEEHPFEEVEPPQIEAEALEHLSREQELDERVARVAR